VVATSVVRRFVSVLFVCSLVVALTGTGATGAAPAAPAQVHASGGTDLPPGFTDGQPVGTADGSGAPTSPGPKVDTGSDKAAAAPIKYFGSGPWAAIISVANAMPKCPGLSASGLAALMVSPVFKESSAASKPTTAPSPMTLSRYDEWNGVYATTDNRSANYGLYAFRNPKTGWVRAYWHPGIGMWQYDSAGVGAPYTAIESMDVRVVAVDVAKGMATRYCSPSASSVGHAAPFSAQERRDSAWRPWWSGGAKGCPLCQNEFARMTATKPYFRNIRLVAGISPVGGAVRRICSIPGQAGAVECWYVNPSVGVIQGATGWATVRIDGYLDPVKAPAPLSRPFYVVKRNGKEERYWIRADTGYSIYISASRTLGKNARPVNNPAGSGLTWTKTGLCDLTMHRGAC